MKDNKDFWDAMYEADVREGDILMEYAKNYMSLNKIYRHALEYFIDDYDESGRDDWAYDEISHYYLLDDAIDYYFSGYADLGECPYSEKELIEKFKNRIKTLNYLGSKNGCDFYCDERSEYCSQTIIVDEANRTYIVLVS